MKKVLVFCVIVLGVLALSMNVCAKEIRNVPTDYPTIQHAVDAPPLIPGDDIIIMVASGLHAGAVIDTPVTIKGTDGAMITSGVPYKSGSSLTTAFRLEDQAHGTEISHLMIPNDTTIGYFFAVFSREVDNVSIHHLTIMNSVQGISNYNGSGWDISHNKLFGTNAVNGGGIGIMINAWDGSQDFIPDNTTADDNIITHNKTEGLVGDVGFSGPGILLSSGHGANGWPGGKVTGNKVYKNTCMHTGSNGVGFEADDVPAETQGLQPGIFSNTVSFNDFRGSTNPMAWYPDVGSNRISRNLGPDANRGEGAQGLTPPEIFN
jgi:hypothetical protein